MAGGILLFGVLHLPARTFSATVPASSSVALAWDRSTSPTVTGYRVYYGGAGGNYTNSVAVGNVTNGTVSGLASGVTYFMAVVARTSTGLESVPSNRISHTVPAAPPALRVAVGSNRQAAVALRGQTGRAYELQASQDLKTWTTLGTVTLGASGSVTYVDVNAASLPRRFYRTRGGP